jgi:serine/threonine-protein kinase
LELSSPWSRDAILAGSQRETAAQVYALVGEQELAIEQLDELLSRPSDVSVSLLRLDPIWDPLRDNPRFQALLARYEN